MAEVYEEDRQTSIMPMASKKLLSVFALGAAIGLFVWGLTFILDTYILRAVLCHGDQTSVCVQASQYAESIASILGAGVGLFFLVKLEIFRPLLIVIGAVVGLWGIVGLAGLLPWYGVALSTIFLYAVAYAAFAWIARVRVFWFVVLLFIVTIVAIRYVFSL
jgi:hypothetical protein